MAVAKTPAHAQDETDPDAPVRHTTKSHLIGITEANKDRVASVSYRKDGTPDQGLDFEELDQNFEYDA